jgi:hypothetical protein
MIESRKTQNELASFEMGAVGRLYDFLGVGYCRNERTWPQRNATRRSGPTSGRDQSFSIRPDEDALGGIGPGFKSDDVAPGIVAGAIGPNGIERSSSSPK